MASASLTLNLTKCEFDEGTVLYLGQQVGKGKVRPADSKVSETAAVPVPTTQRELRCFTRGFVKTSPLTALTSPLGALLGQVSVNMQFKLEVDASNVGAGAVLLQEDGQGVDHPVSYFSRKFDKHQCRYSTIDKETLVLLSALQHLEVYVSSGAWPVKVLMFLSRT